MACFQQTIGRVAALSTVSESGMKEEKVLQGVTKERRKDSEVDYQGNSRCLTDNVTCFLPQ